MDPYEMAFRFCLRAGRSEVRFLSVRLEQGREALSRSAAPKKPALRRLRFSFFSMNDLIALTGRIASLRDGGPARARRTTGDARSRLRSFASTGSTLRALRGISGLVSAPCPQGL